MKFIQFVVSIVTANCKLFASITPYVFIIILFLTLQYYYLHPKYGHSQKSDRHFGDISLTIDFYPRSDSCPGNGAKISFKKTNLFYVIMTTVHV